MTRFAKWSAVFAAAWFVAGCDGTDPSDFPRADPPPDDGTATEATDFSNVTDNGDGTFSVGEGGAKATFDGGSVEDTPLALSPDAAWLIPEGETGEVTFAAPARDVAFAFRNELAVAAASKASAPAALGKVACGVEDQGFDNAADFGLELFARGGFNDWGNPLPAPPYNFVNYGDGSYRAEFEIAEAGDFEFKLADQGWSIEYSNEGSEDVVLDTPAELPGGPSVGATNTILSIPEAGCYNFNFVPVTGEVPAASGTLTVMLAVDEPVDPGEPPEPPDGPTGSSTVRIFDEAGEEIFAAEGTEEYQLVDVRRDDSETGIGRVEVQNILPGDPGTGIGSVAVDDFEFRAPRDVQPETITISYTRPDSDYSATEIAVMGDLQGGDVTLVCEETADSAFGCSVTVTATSGGSITYTVFNDGVADDAGPITVAVNDVGDGSIYSFAGSDSPVTRALPALPSDDPAIEGLDEVILYYFRPDGNYSGWGLHLFPMSSPDWTFFTDGEYVPEGIDDELGAYFRISLPQNASPPYSASPGPLDAFPSSLGFIIHRGDDKDPGPDQFIVIEEDGNIVFVSSGVNEVSTAPPVAGAVSISGAAAHWAEIGTLLWDAGSDVTSVALYYAADAGITVSGSSVTGQDEIFDLGPGVAPSLPNERNLEDLPPYALPAEASDDAANLVRGQLVAVGSNGEGTQVAATNVQTALVLDDLYAAAAADAVLGPTFASGAPSFAVWAPTANSVSVNIYDSASDDTPSATEDMSYDAATGVWSITGTADWDRKYYTFNVNVYAPSVGEVVDNEVTDPYSISLSTGSTSSQRVKSQIVNMDDPDLKPAGWDDLSKPTLEAPEDIVLYELHVRDFSIWDETVDAADRGRYTAFASDGQGVQHLAAMADAGLTHVHVLPSFDIATVNENEPERVDLGSPVEDLCAVNSAAASLCDDFPGQTIEQVLESFPPSDSMQQQIVEWMKGFDGFNWGYDPFHYSTPEGSYATDPEGAQRILEFRAMVQGLSDIGLRTVMDVVYNHTNASGNVSDKSVLDKVVPGYYHRLDDSTGTVIKDSCCDDTAAEHAMMEKLIIDSTVHWVSQYKVDGFRFDLMGFHPLTTMEKVRDATQAVAPETYVYGEGWNFGAVGNDRRFVQATQVNMFNTGIGTFNDRSRDGLRGGGPFDSGVGHIRSQGYASGQFYDPNEENDGDDGERNGLLDASDWIRMGMVGNLRDYMIENAAGETVPGSEINYKGQGAGYTGDPQEIINYASSHDNETQWDIAQYKHPTTTSTADRVRAHNLTTGILLTGQGIPFMHAGQDMLRSKSIDRNSFDSGDWFNRLDFSLADNNWNTGEPLNSENQGSIAQIREVLMISEADPAMSDIAFAVDYAREMLAVRKSSPLFRLRTAAEVNERVVFHNTGPDQVAGLIVMSIADSDNVCSSTNLDAAYSKIVVMSNPTTVDETFALFTDESFDLHPILQSSVDPIVQTADHSAAGFFVPARTLAVFVQDDDTGVDCGPFGLDMFVRGSLNDWGAPDDAKFDFAGATDATVTLNLTPDLYFFKVADDGWTANSNCGAEVSGAAVTVNEPFTMICGESSQNMQVDLSMEDLGDFLLRLDAMDTASPTITVIPAGLDLTPPDVTIDSPADGTDVTGTVTLIATATDDFGIDGVEFFLDGTLLGPGTFDIDAGVYLYVWDPSDPPTADGGYSLSAEATDTSGNTGTSASVSITVNLGGGMMDTEAPMVTLTAPMANADLTGTTTLSATATDNVAVETVLFLLDGGFIGSGIPDTSDNYDFDWDPSGVPDGAYTLTARAVDTSGNDADSAIPITVSAGGGADTTPPEVAIDEASLPDRATGTITVQAMATDNVAVAQVEFRVDDVPFGDPDDTPVGGFYSADLDTTTLTDGDHVLTAIAEDTSGNTTTSDPVTITVDNLTPPTVTLDPVDSMVMGTVSLTATAEDEDGVAEVRFFYDPGNGATLLGTDVLSPYRADWDTTTVANGDYELTVEADDTLGNTGSDPNPQAVTVANAGTFGVDIFLQVCDASMMTRSVEPDCDPLTEGTQTPFTFMGNDLFEVTLTLDAVSHYLRVVDAEGGTIGDLLNCGSQSLFTPVIPGAPFTLYCDAATNSAGFNLSLENQGEYSFMLDASNATDPNLGGVPTDVEELVLTVSSTAAAPPGGGTTPPTVSVDPVVSPVAGEVIVTAQAGDDTGVARVEFYVDGELFWSDSTDPYQAPWQSLAVSNGDHDITATAVDGDGNTQDSAAVTATVDNLGPYTDPVTGDQLQMYVRGSWDVFADPTSGTFLPSDLTYVGGGMYELLGFAPDRINDTTGVHRFKVAAGDFDIGEANCNPDIDNTPAIFAQALQLGCGVAGGNARLNLSLEADGLAYDFVFDANASLTNPLVTVTPSAPPPPPVPDDTIAPTVSLSIDPPDDPAMFDVTIDADAMDNMGGGGVASVTFFIDGVTLWADFTSPFQAPWDTTRVENGIRTLTAEAEDANGNIGTLAVPFEVNVMNPDFGPFGVEMFLRGGFEGWDDPPLPENALLYNGDSTYQITVNVPSAFTQFKVADAAWSGATNCGAEVPAPPFQFNDFDVPFQLLCDASSNNIQFGVLPWTAGDYTFAIDATDFPTMQPTVTVSPAP